MIPDPLRVLHVVTSTDAGGAERMLRRTLRAFAARSAAPRVQSRVTCLKAMGAIGRLLRDEGFDVEALGVDRPRGVVSGARWARHEWQSLRHVRAVIREWRPHLVQSWLPRADLLARFAAAGTGVPVLASIRLLDRDSTWRARLDGATRGLVAGWLAVGRTAADHHARIAGIPRERITVIPNALEEDEMHAPPGAATFRGRHGIPQDAWLVACVARLHAQKGLGDLVRASAELPGAVIAIAGMGPELGELEALARRLRVADRVMLLGHLEDPRELVASSDAFALPSHYEGMPGALLEAMALGRPCVATSIPEIAEIARDGETALLVPAGDPAALAAALGRLRGDDALARRLGQAAREATARDHRMDQHAQHVLALYEQILQAAGAT